MIDSAVSDLPLPDSPTRHKVSPASIWKLTSITAGMNRPFISKPVVRCSTDKSRGSLFAVRGSRNDESRKSEDGELRTANCELRGSDINLLVLAKYPAQRIGNLAQCRASLDRRDDERNEIFAPARGVGKAIQRRLPFGVTSGGTHAAEAVDLTMLDLRVDAKHIDRRRRLGGETVDADHETLAVVDLLLCAVGGLLDFALDQPLLDGRQRAACSLDATEQSRSIHLDPVRHLLNRVGAAAGIDGVGHASF